MVEFVGLDSTLFDIVEDFEDAEESGLEALISEETKCDASEEMMQDQDYVSEEDAIESDGEYYQSEYSDDGIVSDYRCADPEQIVSEDANAIYSFIQCAIGVAFYEEHEEFLREYVSRLTRIGEEN